MATAAEQWYSEAIMHGVSEAVHRAGIAHGQRRYEEGRDGTRRRTVRLLEQYLAELRSGKIQPMDAKAFAAVIGDVEKC
jgi:hypothetical protein